MFTSDGCSLFPDGTVTQKNLWQKCCEKHDFYYWKGGTYQDRIDADVELKECVAETGLSDLSKLMYLGVRVGGSAYIPSSFRWGYGWSYPRIYKPLTALEQENVAESLIKHQIKVP